MFRSGFIIAKRRIYHYPHAGGGGIVPANFGIIDHMNVHSALACVLAFLATGTCGGASATNAFELGEVLAHNETGMSFDINAKVSLV